MPAQAPPPPSQSMRETMPFGYLIHEVAKLMKRRFEEEAKEHGVTLPQFRALAEIWRNPGITQVTLASCIDSDPMTVSGVLERLDKRGLIERFPNPQDSRAKLARVTAEGEKLINEVRATGLTIYQDAMEGVSERERAGLTKALMRIRDNLNQLNVETSLKESA